DAGVARRERNAEQRNAHQGERKDHRRLAAAPVAPAADDQSAPRAGEKTRAPRGEPKQQDRRGKPSPQERPAALEWGEERGEESVEQRKGKRGGFGRRAPAAMCGPESPREGGVVVAPLIGQGELQEGE